MRDHQPPEQRAFPAALLRQQKEYLMNEIAGDRQTSSRRARPLVLRLGIVGALAVIVLAALSLSGIFGGESSPGPLTIDKALAAVTVAQGEILHIKITGVDSDKSTFVQENWSYSDEPWKYRGMTESSSGGRQKVAIDGSGLHQVYDALTNSILETQDEGIANLAEPKVPGDSYEEKIRELLTSGLAQEDGREQVDGREAVRIVEKRPAEDGDVNENVYLVDAETGIPIEWRIMNEGEGRTLRFDIYEKLPGTPENLRLLDLRVAYPGATVYTDPAAFEQALTKAPAQ